jgi:geranylgeranyl diphosphate synthase, type I
VVNSRENIYMDIKNYLTDCGGKIDLFLDNFFLQEKETAEKISTIASQMMEIYREYLRGGKKARGGLVSLGYESAGGVNKEVPIEAGAAVEILHSFLLIHDDWIDQDAVRRGKPTVHKQYEAIFKKQSWRGDGEHWAAGMSIILGDTGCFLAQKILAQMPCDGELKAKALVSLSDYLVKTAYGENLDIAYDFDPEKNYEDILKVKELKTAYYTVVMPLSLGAMLGGANEEKLKAIEEFGLPIGIAFQLRDDELGLFGDEETLGKSNLSDLVEGKKTLLILKALEKLEGEDKDFLLSIWGKREANKDEIKKAKELILKSQALNYSQETSRNLVEQGKKAIGKITDNPEYKQVLESFADFVIARNS